VIGGESEVGNCDEVYGLIRVNDCRNSVITTIETGNHRVVFRITKLIANILVSLNNEIQLKNNLFLIKVDVSA